VAESGNRYRLENVLPKFIGLGNMRRRVKEVGALSQAKGRL
jgi:hypothetical protein